MAKKTKPEKLKPTESSASARVAPVRFVVRGSVVETPEGFKLRF